MINFSVAQDTIKSALIYHLVYLVYGLFIWDFSGLLRKYTLSQLNHMRRPNQSRKHFVFAYNFFNKKKITFPRGLFRTVFTVHAYLLFTSDFNELLNNTVCQNGTVRMQQPRKVVQVFICINEIQIASLNQLTSACPTVQTGLNHLHPTVTDSI